MALLVLSGGAALSCLAIARSALLPVLKLHRKK